MATVAESDYGILSAVQIFASGRPHGWRGVEEHLRKAGFLNIQFDAALRRNDTSGFRRVALRSNIAVHPEQISRIVLTFEGYQSVIVLPIRQVAHVRRYHPHLDDSYTRLW